MDDTKKNIFINSSSSCKSSFVGNHCLRTVTIVHRPDRDVFERANKLFTIIEAVGNLVSATCNDTSVHIFKPLLKMKMINDGAALATETGKNY